MMAAKKAYAAALDGRAPKTEQHCPGMAVSQIPGGQWCHRCGALRIDGYGWLVPLVRGA